MKRHIFHYSISEVVPYIDWNYLLHAWGIPGNGTAEATSTEIKRDAKAILEREGDKFRTHALSAICEARGNGDDIIIEGTAIPFLRQQHARTGCPNMCLSDFISPHGDTIGLFATTVDSGFGNEYAQDPYLSLLSQTLADRLAEATACLMHRQIRTDGNIWGYAPDEKASIEDLLHERHQGIRPAVGYPSLPDQSIIFNIDHLLELDRIGITLTPNGAMSPHASVCGMMFAHPQACYFSIGRISEEQLADYAERRGMTTEEIRKFLTKNIDMPHNG